MAKRGVALFLLLFLGITFFLLKEISGSEEGQEELKKPKESGEKIVSSPKDIREKISVYVFMGWMWLSIFILIYILRQKISEADRILRLKYFKGNKDNS